jgi:transposase
VTNEDKKEIFRCLFEKIITLSRPETIEATVYWKSGKIEPLRLYRKAGRYHLIKHLYDEGFGTAEIARKLRDGENATGQRINITPAAVYLRLKKMGLKPHKRPLWYRDLQQEARERYARGESCRSIAEDFHRRGFKTLTGKKWRTSGIAILRGVTNKRIGKDLREIQRTIIQQYMKQGMSDQEIATELQRSGIIRHGRRPWTAKAVRSRWIKLKYAKRLGAHRKSQNKRKKAKA